MQEERKPFLNSDEALPWEIQEQEEREAAELEAATIKPKPRPKVPEVMSEEIAAQAAADQLWRKWEAAKEKLVATIERSSNDDPQAVLDSLREAAEAAIANDTADAQAKYLLVPDEELPARKQALALKYEETARNVSEMERIYGLGSLHHDQAVMEHAAIGAEKREIEAEEARRQTTLAQQGFNVQAADDNARRFWTDEVTKALQDAQNDPELDPEVAQRYRQMLQTPWSENPQRMKLMEAAMNDLLAAQHEKQVGRVAADIAAELAIEREIVDLFYQDAATADHLIEQRRLKLEADERRRQVEDELSRERAAFDETEFGAALRKAREGIIDLGGFGGR